MRRMSLLAPLLFSLSTHAASQELAATVDQRVRALETRIIDWRRDVHEHPELSNREVRTARLVTVQVTSCPSFTVTVGRPWSSVPCVPPVQTHPTCSQPAGPLASERT